MRKEIIKNLVKTLRLGDRVETCMGAGTVVCFEDHKLHRTNHKYWLSSSFSGDGRIVVALDKPEKWILRSHENPHPFMMPSDIKKIY